MLTQRTLCVPSTFLWRFPGVSLGGIWDGMSIEQKEDMLRQIIDIIMQLFNLTFNKVGSLYRNVEDGAVRTASAPSSATEERGMDRGRLRKSSCSKGNRLSPRPPSLRIRRQLVKKEGANLDYLIADYLAEVTMGLLARRRTSSSDLGGAGTG
ncbi:hypothetical protein BC937DRAFT_94875, partial [Endogone sp. FLAS-F59071]